MKHIYVYNQSPAIQYNPIHCHIRNKKENKIIILQALQISSNTILCHVPWITSVWAAIVKFLNSILYTLERISLAHISIQISFTCHRKKGEREQEREICREAWNEAKNWERERHEKEEDNNDVY